MSPPQQEQLRGDHARGGEHDRPLYDVGQLSYIARPLVLHQPVERLLRHPLCLFAHRPTPVLQKMVGQQRDIFWALAQRQEEERDDMQAVVQIFAKLPGRHGLAQVLVRSGHQTNVHPGGMFCAHRIELTLL